MHSNSDAPITTLQFTTGGSAYLPGSNKFDLQHRSPHEAEFLNDLNDCWAVLTCQYWEALGIVNCIVVFALSRG